VVSKDQEINDQNSYKHIIGYEEKEKSHEASIPVTLPGHCGSAGCCPAPAAT
jgi:hypothetical protein